MVGVAFICCTFVAKIKCQFMNNSSIMKVLNLDNGSINNGVLFSKRGNLYCSVVT